MDQFKVLLQAVLDTKQIGKADITEVQKVLEKYHLNLSADINKAELIKSAKQIVPELEKELKKITGINIKINDVDLLKAVNQVIKNAKQASIAEDKLADSIERVRAKSEQARLAEEKRQVTAQARQQNKVLEEEYLLREKIKAQSDKIQMSLGTGDYSVQIKSHETSLQKLGLDSKEIAQSMSAVKTAFDTLKTSATGNEIIPEQVVANAKMLDKELSKMSSTVKSLKLSDSLNADFLQVDQTTLRLNEQLRKNTAYSKEAKQQISLWLDELGKGNVAEARLKKINSEAKQLHANMAGLNKIGFSWKDKLFQAWEKFGGWSIATGSLTAGVYKIKQAFGELKEIDSILTEISKTSDLTQKQLADLGNASFEAASKYGKKAPDYLTGVQEMYRAGYENSEQLAELSVLAQSAGDMTAELANKYLIATDAAYKLSGSEKSLNDILDGQNYITNHNAVSMSDLADATKVAASQAAGSGVEVNKLTAAVGTMIATTQQGGDIAGRAFKGILMNIQQVKGETDDGELIDDEQLKKVESTCKDVGVALKEVRDGAVMLRDPMEVLGELSEVYRSMDKMDSRRAQIISDIGGKYRGNQLSALLEGWDVYEKMLTEYSNGSGSAMTEAMKSANNWEGSLNRLSNTWTDTVENIVDSKGLTIGINGLNGFLEIINSITSALGGLGTAGAIGGIITFVQNLGWLVSSGLELQNKICLDFMEPIV